MSGMTNEETEKGTALFREGTRTYSEELDKGTKLSLERKEEREKGAKLV
jgi:hypothetical protein